MLSQLTSRISPNGVVIKTNLGQWHPIAFFSSKMILAKTQYETHNGEFLAIIKAFKPWRHYLERCKHEVLVLTDHNNLRRFMDTKSLSSNKSVGPKNSLNTIFESIIARARQMQLQMPFHKFFRKIRMRRMSSELRMTKFFIVCRIH